MEIHNIVCHRISSEQTIRIIYKQTMLPLQHFEEVFLLEPLRNNQYHSQNGITMRIFQHPEMYFEMWQWVHKLLLKNSFWLCSAVFTLLAIFWVWQNSQHLKYIYIYIYIYIPFTCHPHKVDHFVIIRECSNKNMSHHFLYSFKISQNRPFSRDVTFSYKPLNSVTCCHRTEN